MWLLNNKIYPNLTQYVYKNSKTNTPQNKILRSEATSRILSDPPNSSKKKKNRYHGLHFTDKATEI